jgi:hypothetical protein
VSPKHRQQRLVKPLPAWQRRGIYVLGLILLLSGILWLILHHYFLLDGEFGPEHRPLEHTLLVIHGSAAMPMIWLIGVIWTAHIRRGWREQINRTSGLLMLLSMALLALTAAMLYYAGNDSIRAFASITHWLVGIALALGLPLHIWLGRRARVQSLMLP